MPRKVEKTVYQFDELSDSAKEKARDWWREASAGDGFWAEQLPSDFADVLKACGFDVAQSRGRRSEPAIYWELNPDSAAFEATWSASDVNVAPLIADRPVTWKDEKGNEQRSEHNTRLVAILERMATFASVYPDSAGTVSTSRRGASIGDTEWEDHSEQADSEYQDTGAEQFAELARDLAHYFAWCVSREWEYVNSDEYIDDTIRANEYEFTEDGKRYI